MGVETGSRSWGEQRGHWDLADTLLGGTAAMRAKGTTYLPRMRFEEASDHATRLANATLYPAFGETIGSVTGRVFANPPVFTKVPDWITKEVFTDVDRQRQDIRSFLAILFANSLSHGHAAVLVDSPSFDGTPSLKDVREKRLHPYYVLLRAPQILDAKTDDLGLAQLRIAMQEERTDPQDTWSTIMVDVVRVYTRTDKGVSVEVYEKQKNDSGGMVYLLNTARTAKLANLTEIPVVPAYTGFIRPFVSKPPLKELAYLNAKHFNLQSAYDSITMLAMIPILTLIGAEAETQLLIGSKAAVRIKNPDGNLKYTEHTGAAMLTGRQALDKLKEEMRESGAKLLLPQASNTNKTATQASEEAQRENSPLSTMVADFELAVQQLIRFTAMWRGEDAAEATFKLRANLKPDFAPADSATVLINLADRNYLSPETLFAECQRRDIISDQAGSWAEEQARLAKSEDGYLMLSAKAKAQVTDSNPAQAIADGSPQDPKNK